MGTQVAARRWCSSFWIWDAMQDKLMLMAAHHGMLLCKVALRRLWSVCWMLAAALRLQTQPDAQRSTLLLALVLHKYAPC